jgi:hypothetical protein
MKIFAAAVGLYTFSKVTEASVVVRQSQSTSSDGDVARLSANKQSGYPRIVSDETYFLRRRPALPHDLEAKSPEQIQNDVERMMTRLHAIGDHALMEKYSIELAHVEAALADRTRAGVSQTALERKIASMRATLCEQQGFAHHATEDCEQFMLQGCEIRSTSKIKQTKAKANSPVTDAQCEHFFLMGAQREPTDPEKAEDASADAPGEQLLGGKKLRPLPVHGYDEFEGGKLVKHTNETAIADWHKEFGSYSGRRSVNSICRDFPDNEWCQLHTYRRKRKLRKSGASYGSSAATAIVITSIALEVFRCTIV